MLGSEKEWDDVSFLEMEILLDSIDYQKQEFEDIIKYKPESLSKQQFLDYYNRIKSYLNNEMPKEVKDLLDANILTLQDTHKHFDELGYFIPSDFTKGHVNNMMKIVAEGQNSVCSSITLQFEQKMVMTRQAFRGTLTVFNGSETDAMTDVKLNLVVTDDGGKVATSHEFQINPESLTGFNGNLNFEDGWSLDPQ